jgi:F-type H+-transporting ATPase subunit delta
VALRGAAARRYAQAVFDLARDNKTLDKWLSDLQTLNRLFGTPAAVRVLEDPDLKESDQQRILGEQLPDNAVGDLARNLLLLLVKRKRLALLPRILEAYQELYNKEKGIVIAQVTSAIPLDEAHRKRVAEELSKVTGKSVQLDLRQDPSILGGLVARIGDELIDASVATRLADLSERLA